MLIVTLKLPNRRKRILAALAALAILLGILTVRLCRAGQTDALARSDPEVTACLDCLTKFGWEAAAEPDSRESCVLSQDLNADYLALQTEAGFDLSDDLGQSVNRYTFAILNYPTGEQDVVADLLVRDGAVVGGDIRTTALDGFIHSLVMP